jgi:hypothetical protein
MQRYASSSASASFADLSHLRRPERPVVHIIALGFLAAARVKMVGAQGLEPWTR